MYNTEIRLYGTLGTLYKLALGLMWAALALYMLYGTIVGSVDTWNTPSDDPPAAVSLADFNRRTDVHDRDEVSVLGRLEAIGGTEIKRGDETRQLFVVFAPDGGPDDTVVRAMILLTKEDAALFEAQMKATAEGAVTIGGRRVVFPPLDREAEAEVKGRGLTLSDQYIFIDPWLSGRVVPRVGWGKLGGMFALMFFTLAMLNLIPALSRWQHNRSIYARLSPGEVAMLKRQTKHDQTERGILGLIVLIGVIVALVVSRYR